MNCNNMFLILLLLALQEGGSVTAGNSSPITDGACALVLMSAQQAHKVRREKGLRGRGPGGGGSGKLRQEIGSHGQGKEVEGTWGTERWKVGQGKRG